MSNNRGYSNDATDSVRCQLMHDKKRKPHVQFKTAEEIKKYYFDNKKEIKGGMIYSESSIVWEEVMMYCHLCQDDIFSDFDLTMAITAQEEKEGEIKFEWSSKEKFHYEFKYKGFTCTKKVHSEWNGTQYWVYVNDKDGNLIGGKECDWTVKPEEYMDDDKLDIYALFYLLKGLKDVR